MRIGISLQGLKFELKQKILRSFLNLLGYASVKQNFFKGAFKHVISFEILTFE